MAKKNSSGKAIISTIFEYFVLFCVAIIISIFLRAFVFQPFYIPSSSMENTFKINDTIAVNKISARFGKINRGDIVVFKDPDHWVPKSENINSGNWIDSIMYKFDLSDSPDQVYLIKRVIGIEGDVVECKGQGYPITINNKPVQEEYLKEGQASKIPFKVKVPKNRIWVMGDNRNNSGDSRYHQNNGYVGTVSVDSVVGKPFAILWPFSRIQILYGTDAFSKI